METLACWFSVASDWLENHSGAITAVATAFIAWFTIALSISTKRLWMEAKSASGIAKESADAARQAVETMKETAERQLRAYVNVNAGEIRFPSPGLPEATIIIKNTGQTPAYHVRHWIHMWIEEHPLKVELPTPPQDFQMASDVLPPGAISIMPIDKGGGPVPNESIKLLGTAEGTIYIYGMITYKDVFGIERQTKYRLMYGGQKPVAPGKLKPDYDGNEAT